MLVSFRNIALALASLCLVCGLVAAFAWADIVSFTQHSDITDAPVTVSQSTSHSVDTPLTPTPRAALTFLEHTDVNRPLSANESTVRKILIDQLTDDVKTVRASDIVTYPFDLNDDGRDEIFAYVSAPLMCGSHGCALYLYTGGSSATSTTWQPIWFSEGDYLLYRGGPIVVSEHRTDGFTDLLVGCSCDTNTCNDCRRWVYTGQRYQYDGVVNAIQYGKEQ